MVASQLLRLLRRAPVFPAILSVVLMMFATAGIPAARAQQTTPFQTTEKYVETFYPLWFTYYQARLANLNGLVGPRRVTPLYQVVVAINDDTIYGSTYLDLTSEPQVFTLPPTDDIYSVLVLDRYGNIISTNIHPSQAGVTYELIGPDYKGTPSPNLIPIQIPLNYVALIVRADRYTSGGDNVVKEARLLRRNLSIQPLSSYLQGDHPQNTRILPAFFWIPPFKLTADFLATTHPMAFLKMLQTVVDSPSTPPLSGDDQALVDAFNQLMARGSSLAAMRAGCQAAHALIVNTYLDNTGPTNWITYDNIGRWGTNILDRAEITEFIQYANDASAARYYHAFKDANGRALDGSNGRVYVLTFPKGQQPEYQRFWSVTAYTPDAVELIPNVARKYLVASYTPGLQLNSDGSLSIYMSVTRPRGVPAANWLPTRSGPFNVMLRDYGPLGSVADNTYVPPAITVYKK